MIISFVHIIDIQPMFWVLVMTDVTAPPPGPAGAPPGPVAPPGAVAVPSGGIGLLPPTQPHQPPQPPELPSRFMLGFLHRTIYILTTRQMEFLS